MPSTRHLLYRMRSAQRVVAVVALLLYVVTLGFSLATPRGTQVSATHCFCQAHRVLETADASGTPEFRHPAQFRTLHPAQVCVLCSRERDEHHAVLTAASTDVPYVAPVARRADVRSAVLWASRDLYLQSPSHSPPA